MPLKSFLKVSAAAATVTLLSTVAALADGRFIIVDILPLKSGASLTDATAYFRDVEPIFAKYGMTRTDSVLDVKNVVRGTAKANLVNLWVSDNPQASMQGIFSDAEYNTHVANRDRIFDLKDATIMITERKGVHP